VVVSSPSCRDPKLGSLGVAAFAERGDREQFGAVTPP
jgi:hypothetical protein